MCLAVMTQGSLPILPAGFLHRSAGQLQALWFFSLISRGLPLRTGRQVALATQCVEWKEQAFTRNLPGDCPRLSPASSLLLSHWEEAWLSMWAWKGKPSISRNRGRHQMKPLPYGTLEQQKLPLKPRAASICHGFVWDRVEALPASEYSAVLWL